MAWSSHILSSGSRDRNILQRDVRAPEDYIHKLVGHRSEVALPIIIVSCYCHLLQFTLCLYLYVDVCASTVVSHKSHGYH